MAQAETKSAGKKQPAPPKGEALPFTKMNYYIFVAGLIAIILGYITLGQGSMTLAPLLLVLGYCVIVPLAILYRDKAKPATDSKPGA